MSAYPQVPLGEICAINPRVQITKDSAEDMVVSFVPMAAVDERLGTIAVREERPLTDVSKGFTAFEDGDVLFAKITPCMENGKVALARNLTNSIGRGSTEFYVLRPSDRVLSEYIYHFVRQPRFREKAKRHFTGTAGQQRVPKSFMENALVPLPPLAEQRRIADILNRAARIERLRARAADRLREFVPALFIKMFGNPVENPMNEPVALGDLAVSLESGFACGKSRLVERGLPHLRPFNVGRNGEVDLTEIYRVPSDIAPYSKVSLLNGDILFNNTNSRDLVGKVALVRENLEAGFSNHMTRIRPDRTRCEPMFVASYLRRLWSQGYFRDRSTQWVNQAGYSPRLLARMLLHLPPLEEQRRFVNIANRATHTTTIVETASKTASTLSASLMARLLGNER